MNSPKITEITEVKTENEDVKTFMFEYSKEINPGQFFMIWIPGVDEIPMSVSYIANSTKGITFRRVGEATNALFNFEKGDKIGIRGPYGNGFKIDGKRILFVGGGTGIAMLAPAVEEAINYNISSTFVIGVKTHSELFFEDRLKDCGAEIHISTDDGSKGYKGYATDLVDELFFKEKFTSVLTCGPEIMMNRLFDTCNNIPFQASLERYMKCGVGICSQCCIDKGLRVCVEGPVFDGETLKKIEDFGAYKRDASGRKIKF